MKGSEDMGKMPSAVEKVEQLSRESERQKVQIEQLKAENEQLKQQIAELEKQLGEK